MVLRRLLRTTQIFIIQYLRQAIPCGSYVSSDQLRKTRIITKQSDKRYNSVEEGKPIP